MEATQSPEEKLVYELLFTRGEMHVDAIARALSWKINQLLPSLMTMELKGMVRALPGKKYEAI
jgi:DNA processing protein